MIELNPDPAKPLQMSRWFEAVFDTLYLFIAAYIGVKMLWHQTGIAGILSGVMALVLAGGDAFHLIPRIIVAVSGNYGRLKGMLGLGKLITSITMTLFYILLWHIGLLCFTPALMWEWTALVYILAGLRIVLCLFKQNGWTCAKPSVRWAVLRNVPFLLLGITVAFFWHIQQRHRTA